MAECGEFRGYLHLPSRHQRGESLRSEHPLRDDPLPVVRRRVEVSENNGRKYGLMAVLTVVDSSSRWPSHSCSNSHGACNAITLVGLYRNSAGYYQVGKV